MVLRALALGVVTLMIAAAPAAPAGAGAVRGRVELRREPPPAEGRPAIAELGGHGPHDAGDRRTSVVYLEAGPQGAFDDTVAPMRARLDQRNESFVPGVLAITAGSTVDFPNSDRTYHNVFSLSRTKRFDLGRYPRGQSRSVRFERAGVVRVFCEIHSHMSAWILVFAHRYFATTDAEGRYRIDGIPPGLHTLAVWNDGQVVARRELRVAESGELIDADFVVD